MKHTSVFAGLILAAASAAGCGGGPGGGHADGGGPGSSADLATPGGEDQDLAAPSDDLGGPGPDLAVPPGGAYDWLQFGGSPQHLSHNGAETILTAANVSTLKRLYQISLPS